MPRTVRWMFSLLLPLVGCSQEPGRATTPATSGPPPNIVFILADDLGWGDVGFTGGSTPTPEIDGLAASGTILTQHYVLQSCTPTRAALLTGRYPMRYGLQLGISWATSTYGLPAEQPTLAEVLRAAGYRTAIVGKWHLGQGPAQVPLARGFEHHYGTYIGQVEYYSHEHGGELAWVRNGKRVREPGYATDLLAIEAAGLIREHDPSRPLFLYVPFTAVHTPLEAPDALRAQHEGLAEPARTYRAMITSLDQNVGRIVTALDRAGMRRNTLVVFASDNGAAGHGSNAPLRGTKRDLYEGALRVPALVSWPGTLPAGETSPLLFHAVDWFPTLMRVAGQAAPADLDGLDLWDALRTGGAGRSEVLLNASPVASAIRDTRYKLLVTRPGAAETLELFDLGEDPGETRNVAAELPDVVRRLRDRLATFEQDAVEPLSYGSEDRVERRRRRGRD